MRKLTGSRRTSRAEVSEEEFAEKVTETVRSAPAIVEAAQIGSIEARFLSEGKYTRLSASMILSRTGAEGSPARPSAGPCMSPPGAEMALRRTARSGVLCKSYRAYRGTYGRQGLDAYPSKDGLTRFQMARCRAQE